MNIFDITRFNARGEENRELKRTSEALRKELEGLKKAYEFLSGDNDSLYSENTQLLNTIDVLRNRNEKLGQELAETQIKLRGYTEALPPDTALGTLQRRHAKKV